MEFITVVKQVGMLAAIMLMMGMLLCSVALILFSISKLVRQ